MRFVAMLAVLALAGCTAERQFVIDTTPVRVGVFEDGKPISSGERSTVTLGSNRPHVLRLEAEGFVPETVILKPEMQGSTVAVYVLECIVFPPGLLALPACLENGYFQDFDPKTIRVVMKPEAHR